MSLQLPERPNLEFLRRHAKAVLQVGRLLRREWRLADAQRALARGYGRKDWAELVSEVRSRVRVTGTRSQLSRGSTVSASGAASSPAAIGPLAGLWVSSSDQVALEIRLVRGELSLTQVFDDAGGQAIASSLLLRADGREHPLPFTNGLHVTATWRNERTLDTVARRDGSTIARGTYACSDDGNVLTVTAPARDMRFDRVTPDRQPSSNVRRGHAPGARATSRLLMAMAGAAIVWSAGCAGDMQRRTDAASVDRAVDRAAIEALNRHDIAAALASDVDAIVSQWTENFVLLPPIGPIVRGRAANLAMLNEHRQQLEKFEPVAYDVDIEEIVVSGEYAFAWGQFRTVARPRGGGADIASSGKLLRVYQRQRDGRWLMHRTMSTMDSTRP